MLVNGDNLFIPFHFIPSLSLGDYSGGSSEVTTSQEPSSSTFYSSLSEFVPPSGGGGGGGGGGVEPDAVEGAEESGSRADVNKLHAFKKLMESQQKAHGQQHGRRYQLLKINMAISVLYARKVLAALLAHWPFKHDKERAITAELLSCKDEQQIPCVLDLLQKSQPLESFRKVVKNVIQMCHPKCLLPMAITACHFMEEITFLELTRESEHNYAATSQVEEKVRPFSSG